MMDLGGWWAVRHADHYYMILAVFREEHHAQYFASTRKAMTGHRANVTALPRLSALDIPE